MVALHILLANSTLCRVIKRLHCPPEIMLVCVRWCAAFALSQRKLEEMMAERGVMVDHATVQCWALTMLPMLACVLHRRKLPVGPSWRVDETYMVVGGRWWASSRSDRLLGTSPASRPCTWSRRGSSAAPAAWPFRQPTTSTAWLLRGLLVSIALPRPATLIATEPASARGGV